MHEPVVAKSFGENLEVLTSTRTAGVIASSPRFRRKSSTFVDAIHDLAEKPELAPAQLYSTESGRLFHSGRIVIITVGLPARGKTCVGSVHVIDNFC
jgi:6-phosphofructo-2-kinase / fructose-2,6-biphosphatase 4